MTDRCARWWKNLERSAQDEISAAILLLGARGPHLTFPYSSAIRGSRHSHMRELRVQVRGKPIRILYAFDPRRVAILLVGADKTGDDRWYESFVPVADRLYDEHLEQLTEEGVI